MAITTDLELLKFRRTKIVSTIGPASRDEETLGRLMDAGVNVVRLNMSHGEHADHRETYERVRRIAKEKGLPICVLADLCGPKIRAGIFPEGSIELEDGATVTMTTRKVEGAPGLIPSQYAALAGDVKTNDRILLDDGNLELCVLSVEGTEISCEVVAGGRLKNRKGINLPGVDVSAPSLTAKDRVDAAFALELGVDMLALSFVRRAEDVQELRDLIAKANGDVGIISKIEKPEALENIEEILELSDGIMVARGDLGVELPPEAVPLAQDELIELARKYRKPVIVATQMLESMIDHPRPTRAEVSDVANAVRAGADAVMLSAETAAGKYPVRAVEMMDIIARQTEAHLWDQGAFKSLMRAATPPMSIEAALAESTALLSRALLVRAIVIISMKNHSTKVMSASRPGAPLVAVAVDAQASRRANLLWGVVPRTAEPGDLADPVGLARRLVNELELAEPGQSILEVRGFHDEIELSAPSVRILRA